MSSARTVAALFCLMQCWANSQHVPDGPDDSQCVSDAADETCMLQTATAVHTSKHKQDLSSLQSDNKITSRQMATSTCHSCGYKPNSNIGWTGSETVTWVGTDDTDDGMGRMIPAWQKCCDECKAKKFDDPPCAAWVFMHDGHCYQKYDTGEFPVTQSDGADSSDAGLIPKMHCASCGFKANSNIGWTGKETISFVGKDSGIGGTIAGWQKCCDECKTKALDDPPCAAWVFMHDGHCYQKYDTGEFEVTQSDGSETSDAGVIGCSTSGFQANTNVGWTGKETVTFVGKGNSQLCRKQCQAKAFDDPPCAGWVFIHDGHCYQKYDTGEFAVTMSESDSSDAGLVSKC